MTTMDATSHYMELFAAYPLRPIQSADSHQQAKKVLRGLMGDTTADARDYKKLLVQTIAAYEREAALLLDNSDVTAADVVRHLLDERGQSVNAFAKEHGISQSSLSAALSGKREWSKGLIVAVADSLGLDRGLFLRD